MAIGTTQGPAPTVTPASKAYKTTSHDEWLHKHCGYNPVGEAVCDPNDPWFQEREVEPDDLAHRAAQAVKDKYVTPPSGDDWAEAVMDAAKTAVRKGPGVALEGFSRGFIPEAVVKNLAVAAIPALSDVPEEERRAQNTAEDEAQFARRFPGVSLPDAEPDAAPPIPANAGEAPDDEEEAAQASLPTPAMPMTDDPGAAPGGEGSGPPTTANAGEAPDADEEAAQASLPYAAPADDGGGEGGDQGSGPPTLANAGEAPETEEAAAQASQPAPDPAPADTAPPASTQPISTQPDPDEG